MKINHMWEHNNVLDNIKNWLTQKELKDIRILPFVVLWRRWFALNKNVLPLINSPCPLVKCDTLRKKEKRRSFREFSSRNHPHEAMSKRATKEGRSMTLCG